MILQVFIFFYKEFVVASLFLIVDMTQEC